MLILNLSELSVHEVDVVRVEAVCLQQQDSRGRVHMCLSHRSGICLRQMLTVGVESGR